MVFADTEDDVETLEVAEGGGARGVVATEAGLSATRRRALLGCPMGVSKSSTVRERG